LQARQTPRGLWGICEAMAIDVTISPVYLSSVASHEVTNELAPDIEWARGGKPLAIGDGAGYNSPICSPLDTPQGLGRGYFALGGLDVR